MNLLNSLKDGLKPIVNCRTMNYSVILSDTVRAPKI